MRELGAELVVGEGGKIGYFACRHAVGGSAAVLTFLSSLVARMISSPMRYNCSAVNPSCGATNVSVGSFSVRRTHSSVSAFTKHFPTQSALRSQSHRA